MPDNIDDDESSSLMHNRRLSIIDQPIGLFRGPNSLHNFASSFTRAQSFAAHKIDSDIKKKRSFFVSSPQADNQADELFDPGLMVPSSQGERLSNLLNEYSSYRSGYSSFSPYNEVFYQDDIVNMLNQNRSRQNSTLTTHSPAIPIPSKRMHQARSFSSMRLGLSYASVASHFSLKKVEDGDGNVVTLIAGQSTAPQTVFNSVNVLIGVGLLALPVGLLKTGWVLGVPLLVICCLTTFWSARLLSKSLDTDATLMTYADLGYASYGSTAKLLISLLFSIDLLGLGVSLVLLFSDSLFSLIGDDVFWTKTNLKLLAFVVLTPFTFMPLPVLSVFSLFGIISTISITMLVFACGLLKPYSPGSLIEVMPTNIWPQSFPDFFIGLGILMAPFGGHAIFPNLKSDMRHPHKFTQTLFQTYTITLLTDCSMAVVGFLMFGALCNNEVTSLLLETAGYPKWVYPLISGLICIVPLAKTPLNAKPIISTLDSFLGIHIYNEDETNLMYITKNVAKFITRISVNALFVGFAILLPEFDKIIGILGSSICFIICIILPCLFYLKLCKDDINTFERLYIWLVILGSLVLAGICTVITVMY